MNTLQECRRSLTQAFWVQGQLSSQAATTLPDRVSGTESELEQQVEAWERLYVSLVGSRKHLLNLTEEQLQTLLNPVQFLPSSRVSGTESFRTSAPQGDQRQGALSHQLEDLRQQLEGRPLKVKLLRVDPSQLDADGILGLIDQIQQDLSRLQTAPTRLPAQLATLENLLRQPPIRIPGLTGLLSQAKTLHQQGLDLDGLELAEAGIRLIELLARIQDWQAEGYRFPTQAADFAQLDAVLGSLRQLRPTQVASAIPTLKNAIHSLESHCRAHIQQHQKNQKALTSIQSQFQALSRQRLPALERRMATTAKQTGIHFPPYRVSGAEPFEDLNEAKQILLDVERKGIPAIQRWNSLTEQQFAQARQEIERVQTVLRRCQEILDRLEQALRRAEQQSYDWGGNTVVVNSEAFGETHSGDSWEPSSGDDSSRRSSGGSSRRR